MLLNFKIYPTLIPFFMFVRFQFWMFRLVWGIYPPSSVGFPIWFFGFRSRLDCFDCIHSVKKMVNNYFWYQNRLISFPKVNYHPFNSLRKTVTVDHLLLKHILCQRQASFLSSSRSTSGMRSHIGSIFSGIPLYLHGATWTWPWTVAWWWCSWGRIWWCFGITAIRCVVRFIDPSVIISPFKFAVIFLIGFWRQENFKSLDFEGRSVAIKNTAIDINTVSSHKNLSCGFNSTTII